MAPARIWKLPLLALLLAPTLTKGFSAETVSTREPTPLTQSEPVPLLPMFSPSKGPALPVPSHFRCR